jgi:3-methyladenine DNA glycosylase AlkD
MKAENISTALLKLGNKKIAEHSQRFFKTGKGEYGEGDIFVGIRVPVVRAEAKKYYNLSLSETGKLLKSPYHEIRLCALLILVEKYSRGDEKGKTQTYNFYLKNTKHINNWDLVDLSAYKIVGPYLEDKSRKPLYKLAKSKSLWERRISIISLFHMIKNNDFNDALEISEILLNDKEDLMHKAVGWMLREVGNRDRKTEEIFLKKHYKQMPRTMLRYAIEKFPETLRKRYLLGKI